MNSKLVLAVIVILLLLYVIFKALTTTYSTLGTMQKWTNKTTLQSSNLPSTFKANSAISIWFYIKKWVGGANVVTFHSGTSSSSGNTILRVLFNLEDYKINLFQWCCDFINFIGRDLGYDYQMMNLLIFVLILPGIFFNVLFIAISQFIVLRKNKNS
jgi:hypothetical protein